MDSSLNLSKDKKFTKIQDDKSDLLVKPKASLLIFKKYNHHRCGSVSIIIFKK